LFCGELRKLGLQELVDAAGLLFSAIDDVDMLVFLSLAN
jgi:hypothetical protein